MFKSEFSSGLRKKVWYISEKLNKSDTDVLAKFYHYKDTHKRHLFEKMKKIIQIRSGDKFDEVWEEFCRNANVRKSDMYILNTLSKYKSHVKHSDPLEMIKKIKISGETYLDVGCANGALTMKMAQHFKSKNVYGTDITSCDNEEFIFIPSDGTKIDMKDDSVDIITMVSTLHHISDLSLIGDIKRVLKKNGSLIIYDNYVSGEFKEVMTVLHNFMDDSPAHYRDLKTINGVMGMWEREEIKFTGPENIFVKRWTHRRNHFRTLTDSIPRMKYKRRSKDIKNVLHWGQRKLLMTEIEFLTKYYKLFKPTKKVYMIYAGAAAGTHLLILKELFPDIYLELYDANPFDRRLKSLSNVNMYRRYFYDSDAKYWNSSKHDDKHILLVSDIRTADTESMSSDEIEQRVKTDHKMQRSWYELMEPEYSMFKFRLPWEDGETEYMSGQIYIQPWAPVTSTETRLIVKKNASLVLYDNRDYEERLFHYNVYEREMEYSNVLEHLTKEEKNGLDNRYDSVSEIEILRRCLKDTSGILEMSNRITKCIGGRSLMESNTLKKGRSLIIKMKRLNMVPLRASLTQKTYNDYVIPNWEKLVKMKLVEDLTDEEMFKRD